VRKVRLEGWGLTPDDHRLIMVGGSSKLRFLDRATSAELSRVEVSDGDKPVEHLNELEFVDGRIYANVWLQDRPQAPCDRKIPAKLFESGSGRSDSSLLQRRKRSSRAS
jgi:hypothetical protein